MYCYLLLLFASGPIQDEPDCGSAHAGTHTPAIKDGRACQAGVMTESGGAAVRLR